VLTLSRPPVSVRPDSEGVAVALPRIAALIAAAVAAAAELRVHDRHAPAHADDAGPVAA